MDKINLGNLSPQELKDALKASYSKTEQLEATLNKTWYAKAAKLILSLALLSILINPIIWGLAIVLKLYSQLT